MYSLAVVLVRVELAVVGSVRAVTHVTPVVPLSHGR